MFYHWNELWKMLCYFHKEKYMEEKSGNYVSDIHNENYESEYLESRLNASNLINIAGRETESLNGRWNFVPDLYDTCRRAHWYSEKRFDSDGREIPVDYDWEG